MAQENNKIQQYFPNLKIRTMTLDLERLKQGGGTFIPEPTPETKNKTEFLFEEEKPKEVKPPEFGSVQPNKTNPEPTPAIPSSKPETITKPLIIISSILGITFIASLAFWVIYPEISKRLSQRKHPAPSPAAITQTTPSPSPISPSIKVTGAEKVRLILQKNTPQELLDRMKIELLVPKQPGSFVVFELLNNRGKYLDSLELIKLISPDSLTSFKSAPGETYLIFGYWSKPDQSKTGLVFSLRPETLMPTQAIMKSWETTNVEEYFPIIFLPELPPKRKQEQFKDVIINSIPARKITFGSTAFIYGFRDNYLIITSDEQVFKTITSLIK